jgi:hypothetical protein
LSPTVGVYPSKASDNIDELAVSQGEFGVHYLIFPGVAYFHVPVGGHVAVPHDVRLSAEGPGVELKNLFAVAVKNQIRNRLHSTPRFGPHSPNVQIKE